VDTGAKVISRDDKHIGDVSRVITDSQAQQVTHLVISQGLFFHEEKTIPIGWVDELKEDKVHLAVNASQVDRVPSR
jgi:uncharacterized protein YrrD